MLQHHFPSKWPPRFARLILLLSELLFAWAVIKVIFAPHRGTIVPYVLAFESSFSLIAPLVVWAGIGVLFITRFIWSYRIGWLVGSIFCAVCATFILLESDVWQPVDMARFNGQTFHLAHSDEDKGWTNYLLCQCDESDILCRCRVVYATSPPLPANLVIDQATQKLQVILRGSTYHLNDLVVYTLDSSGQQWCLNDNRCTSPAGG